ncbi:MAG: hypothetical protein AAB591_01270, partial [Patescibacteria group bacterium]
MQIEDSRLKSFLLDEKLLSPRELGRCEEEAKKTGKSLHEAVLNLGALPEDKLRELEALILGIPFIDLTKETIEPKVLHMIPEPIARKSNIIAYRRSGKGLEVAMLDPDDIQTVEFIKKTAHLKVLPRLTTTASIRAALKQYQKSLEAEFSEIIKQEAEQIRIVGEGETPPEEAEDLKKLAEDLPIVKIVDTLIRHAILEQASDIHIEPE